MGDRKSLKTQFLEMLPKVKKCGEIIENEKELAVIIERLAIANERFLSYEEVMKNSDSMTDIQVNDLEKIIHEIGNLADAAELRREAINLLREDMMQ